MLFTLIDARQENKGTCNGGIAGVYGEQGLTERRGRRCIKKINCGLHSHLTLTFGVRPLSLTVCGV